MNPAPLKKMLPLMPDVLLRYLLQMNGVPKGLYFYYLNPDNGHPLQKARMVYSFFAKRYSDNFQGHYLFALTLIQCKCYAECEGLLHQLIQQLGRSPQLYKLQIKLAMLDKGLSRLEAIKAVFYSTPFEQYLKLLDGSAEPTQPLHYQSIIIVTHGRTGSTLLQGVLNSIAGVKIQGENYNAFYHLFNFYKAYQETNKKHPWAVLPKHPFYKIQTSAQEQQILERLRGFVQQYFAGDVEDQVFGFKEIRYFHIPNQTQAYLNFLNKTFPNPLFVFLKRNPSEVVQSAWWAEQNPTEVKGKLEGLYTTFDAFERNHPEQCFSLDYQDIIGKSKRLEQLFGKLGAEYDAQKIDFILSVPHSYAPRNENKSSLFNEFPI